MDKLKWCLKQKNGIILIDPNNNLAKAYLVKSADSLETMQLANAADWKISAAYYSMYFAVYALCMKTGVKSEIHSCTLELASLFYLSKEDADLFSTAFRARNDAQYYVDKEVQSDVFDLVVGSAAAFVTRCKRILDGLSESKVLEIRKKMKTNNR